MRSGRQQGQPDSGRLVFFLDRGLGRHVVADAIRAWGYEALPMADVYTGGQDLRLPDAEWMRRADRECWVAISKDKKIPRDHADTLSATTLRLFLIPNANMPGTEIVRRLMTNWDAILRRTATSGPYAYAVLPNRLEKRWP
jgi:hypothetical protein